MSMDSTTANLLLGCLRAGHDNNEIADLYKQIVSSGTNGGLTDDEIEVLSKYIGENVRIRGTPYKGVIRSVNKASSGFYPGRRYPLYVELTNTENAGYIFEYALDQVSLFKDGEYLSFKELFEKYVIADNNGVPESVMFSFTNRIGNAILLASGDDVCIFKAFNTDPISGVSGFIYPFICEMSNSTTCFLSRDELIFDDRELTKKRMRRKWKNGI